MSNNMRVLLVGPGYMGIEYTKVLASMGCEIVTVGRGAASAKKYEDETGIKVITGGIERALTTIEQIPEYAIIATPIDSIAKDTRAVLAAKVKHVLVEKPAGLSYSEVHEVAQKAKENGSEVFVAYNRRFYASTNKALEIIREDGGVRDIHFEFTEWSNRMGKRAMDFSEEVREATFVANSTHVVDLAFFIGGKPKEWSAYAKADPSLLWHKTGCIYAGAGITERDVLFSYCADWGAPGRWAVEIMTSKHRLYLKPMEELWIQQLDSVAVNKVELDDLYDREFKPGLFKQTESFLNEIDDGKKISIDEQLEHMKLYAQIEQKEII